MSGNTFGLLYCVTSFGESHGPAYGGVVDGCPPGLELAESHIQKELDRRKPGSSRHVTQRQESDRIEILSGVFEGRTTGTAIGFLIRNEDQRSKDYSAIAKKWLRERYGVEVRGHLAQLGPNRIAFKSWESVDENPFFSPDPAVVPKLEQFMDELRKSGDSCGARVNVVASAVPVGWGEPVYGRLDSDIAAAMMGINAVKGVEIGAGFAAIEQKGSEHGDELTPQGFLSNNAGGTLGGISTGQDILVSIALKPTSSIRVPYRRRLAFAVDRAARNTDAGSGLERDADQDILPGRDAAERSARVVREKALRRQLVAVLRALLFNCSKTGADLDTFHGVDAHHRRSDVRVEPAVDRLAPADRHCARHHVHARPAGIA